MIDKTISDSSSSDSDGDDGISPRKPIVVDDCHQMSEFKQDNNLNRYTGIALTTIMPQAVDLSSNDSSRSSCKLLSTSIVKSHSDKSLSSSNIITTTTTALNAADTVVNKNKSIGQGHTMKISSSIMSTYDTPDRWRMRLWPSKALISFCRTLTRCKPINCRPGMKLSNHGGGGGDDSKVDLLAHWSSSDLLKVPVSFDNVLQHSSTFFLLLIEECRESVMKGDVYIEDHDTTLRYNSNINNNRLTNGGLSSHGWMDGIIQTIISESEFSTLPKSLDPRLGSVWLISTSITSSYKTISSTDLSGGDLVVMHSSSWKHPLLGVVQPWDPDYDLKYGINLHINQMNPSRSSSMHGDPHGPLNINILICVDRSSPDDLEKGADIGGWAYQGTVMTGVTFTLCVLG